MFGVFKMPVKNMTDLWNILRLTRDNQFCE